MHVSLQNPASRERQDRTDPVRVQNSSHVDDDMHICVCGHSGSSCFLSSETFFFP